MTNTPDGPEYWDALGPDAPADALPVAEQLRQSRPLANPGFRGDLGRALETIATHVDPQSDVRMIMLMSMWGIALLVIAALSAAGIGPLG